MLGQSEVTKISEPLDAPTKLWIVLALEAFGLSASSKEDYAFGISTKMLLVMHIFILLLTINLVDD